MGIKDWLFGRSKNDTDITRKEERRKAVQSVRAQNVRLQEALEELAQARAEAKNG